MEDKNSLKIEFLKSGTLTSPLVITLKDHELINHALASIYDLISALNQLNHSFAIIGSHAQELNDLMEEHWHKEEIKPFLLKRDFDNLLLSKKPSFKNPPKGLFQNSINDGWTPNTHGSRKQRDYAEEARKHNQSCLKNRKKRKKRKK